MKALACVNQPLTKAGQTWSNCSPPFGLPSPVQGCISPGSQPSFPPSAQDPSFGHLSPFSPLHVLCCSQAGPGSSAQSCSPESRLSLHGPHPPLIWTPSQDTPSPLPSPALLCRLPTSGIALLPEPAPIPPQKYPFSPEAKPGGSC